MQASNQGNGKRAMAVGIPGIGGWANRSAHVETCSAHAGGETPAEQRPPSALPRSARPPCQARQAIARQFAHAG